MRAVINAIMGAAFLISGVIIFCAYLTDASGGAGNMHINIFGFLFLIAGGFFFYLAYSSNE